MMIRLCGFRLFTFLTALILLLAGCSDESGQQRYGRIEKVKQILAEARSSYNLIKGIDTIGSYYVFHFEEGSDMAVNESLIEDATIDSLTWEITFSFNNDSKQTCYFLGKLSILPRHIATDPYGACPLSALAKFSTPVPGKFTIIVHGKSDGVSVSNAFSNFSQDHELPLLGLYENYSNLVEFQFQNSHNEVRCSETIALDIPALVEKPVVETQVLYDKSSLEYRGLYFISNYKLGLDQLGEIRWIYSGEGVGLFGKLRNGNFLVAGKDNLKFKEITMLGQTVKVYDVPNKLHHEIVEMPSGNFLVATHTPPGPPLEDVIVEIDRVSGAISKSWDFNKILDPTRMTLPNVTEGDWLHINSVYYDSQDRSIIVSGRNQCTVAKIDYETDSIKWILSNHNFWKTRFQKYLLKPVDQDGSPLDISQIDFWPYGQHAAQLLSNKNLLLYDNGDFRGYYDNPVVPSVSYTRITEYQIDEINLTVKMAWEFNHDKSIFTKLTGYTQELGHDTRLVAYMWMSGATPRIVEVNLSKEIIFNATVNVGKANLYRTMKMELYKGIN